MLKMSSSPASSRPFTPASSSSDEDEHTISAYGDISLSNIYFIPSLPSTVPPRRDDSGMDEEKGENTPPFVHKRSVPKHALPSVIRKILPPSPSAAELSPQSDFERLVSKLRETRVSDRSPPHPGLMLPTPSKPILIHQPQPRQAASQKVIDKMQDKAGMKDTPAKERVLLQPSARMNAAKPKDKPFRGGRLPVRPPLPRWDLHEPIMLSKGSA
ncbi:hypothetical protein C0995_002511 [Termitomyces sp. Mi166|nr:hypothetical protein C0995_002511 [Termitomyces sp. Mi166\